MVNKFTILLFAAAATTLIAGILHINRFIETTSSGEKIGNPDILFLVGGIAQVFWVIPIIRQWGENMVFYRYSRNSSVYVIMDNY
jgi:hypothetical protein